jgi:hypothetical protein
MRGRPYINLLCLVLCLMASIVRYMGKAPPINDTAKRLFSLTRLLCLLAALLSAIVMNIETSQTIKR